MADTELLERSDPQAHEGGVGLAVVSIAKSYDKRPVLSDVSLSVGRGEVVGLLGPNGAGKTTCFYSIMGLVKPDAGRILLDGDDITGLPMYRRAILGLGYLPQETSIFRGLSVAKNISAVLELSEPDKAQRAERLEFLLSEFGLEKLRRFRAANGGAARLPARWPPAPRSCCSTSPLPGSIRCRSPTFAIWSRI
jgi:lipopolysaccharide export system ATP-binding protein